MMRTVRPRAVGGNIPLKLVYVRNKENGTTYVYESRYYWNREKRQTGGGFPERGGREAAGRAGRLPSRGLRNGPPCTMREIVTIVTPAKR